MLSYYCSGNVEFTARPEVGIGFPEVWVDAQVSINKMGGNNRCIMVQTRSDTDMKILYAEIITKQVKFAFDEEASIIIFYHPRTTPKQVNEYKLRFANHVDFWNCMSVYVKARIGAEAAVVQQNAAKDAEGKLAEVAGLNGPTETGVQGNEAGRASEGVPALPSIAEPVVFAADFAWLE